MAEVERQIKKKSIFIKMDELNNRNREQKNKKQKGKNNEKLQRHESVDNRAPATSQQ